MTSTHRFALVCRICDAATMAHRSHRIQVDGDTVSTKADTTSVPETPLAAIVDNDASIRNATQHLLKAAGSSTATLILLGFDSEHDQIRTQS